MSKLFDTLEQIRENESYRPPDSAVTELAKTKQSKKIPLRTVIMFACIAGLIGYIFLSDVKDSLFGTPEKKETALATASMEASPAVPVPGSSLQITPLADTQQSLIYNNDNLARWQEEILSQEISQEKKSVLLNNIAAYYIFHRQYWKGLSFLDEALHIQPKSAEMLINYAVALTELNLLSAAGVYLEKAYLVDADHPALVKNLELLKEAGVVEDTIFSLYSKLGNNTL